MGDYHINSMGNAQLWEPDESGQLAAENADVTNWTVGDPFILIGQVFYDGACNKATVATGLKLQFDKDDAGSWTDVGAATEISYTEDTTLVNDAGSTDRSLSDPSAGACSGGWITGVECTDGACSHAIDPRENWSDVHWALDTDNASAGVKYTFRVWDTTNNQVLGGTAYSAELTVAAADVNIQATCDTLTLTENVATVNAEVEVDAGTAGLSLVAHQANINAEAEWTGKICGVTNPSKICGVAVTSISKVWGVE